MHSLRPGLSFCEPPVLSPAFHLRLSGSLLILLAGMHLFLPRRYRWHEELSQLSLLNRQIFWAHTFFICLVLVMMGALSALATDCFLLPSKLSRLVLGGFAFFWFIRLVFQLFIFDRKIWRGHRVHTAMHWLLTLLWTYLTVIYTSICLLQH